MDQVSDEQQSALADVKSPFSMANFLCLTSSAHTITIDVKYASPLSGLYKSALVVVGREQHVAECAALLSKAVGYQKRCRLLCSGRLPEDTAQMGSIVSRHSKVLLIPHIKAPLAVGTETWTRKRKHEKTASAAARAAAENAEYKAAAARAKTEVLLRFGATATRGRVASATAAVNSNEPGEVALVETLREKRCAFLDRLSYTTVQKIAATADRRAAEEVVAATAAQEEQTSNDRHQSLMDDMAEERAGLDAAILSGDRQAVMEALFRLSDKLAPLPAVAPTTPPSWALGSVSSDTVTVVPALQLGPAVVDTTAFDLPWATNLMRPRDEPTETRAPDASAFAAVPLARRSLPTKHTDEASNGAKAKAFVLGDDGGEVATAPVKKVEWYVSWTGLADPLPATASKAGVNYEAYPANTRFCPTDSAPPAVGGGTVTPSVVDWWSSWVVPAGGATDIPDHSSLAHVGVPWSALGGRPIGG